ncbi:MAG: thioesterase domain-containing protein [Ilumatobacteraceae bacterium]
MSPRCSTPRGHRVPFGTPGELWLGGANVARGYLGNPEATAERFVDDPFRTGERLYRTGDRVRWSEAGELEFLGRTDHQVKFRGFRIEPSEIASVLSDAPGVTEAAVAVRQSRAGAARLVGWVQLDDPHTSLAGLRQFVADRLPDYMVPTHLVVVERLALTASGKVDLQNLPAPNFDRSSLDTPWADPTTVTEREVTEFWQALLEMDHIGIDDDFFDLGGDSLMAVELFSMLRDRYEVELPLGALAQTPTVRGLAALVDRARSGGYQFEIVVPIRTGGTRTPLFCVHGGSGNVASFPRLARALGADQPFYGVQWPGLVAGDSPRSIASLADRYLDEIRRVQPVGPYVLAGQCIGGLIAQQMAHRLVEQGERVDLLVMYDSPMVYSPAFTPSGRLPELPDAVRPVLNRALDWATFGIRLAKRRNPPAQVLRVKARQALRRPPHPDDAFLHAASLLASLVWRHRPPVDDVPTLFVHSDETNAGNMSLTGTWNDGVLGWRHRLSDTFQATYADGGHNDLLYSDDAVAAVQQRLDAVAERG